MFSAAFWYATFPELFPYGDAVLKLPTRAVHLDDAREANEAVRRYSRLTLDKSASVEAVSKFLTEYTGVRTEMLKHGLLTDCVESPMLMREIEEFKTKIEYVEATRDVKVLETCLNLVLTGSPGTGKTTMAKLYGRILAALGFLADGSVELKTPSDLTGSAVGETAEKTSAVIENARGKVLVIDEAYALNEHTGGYGAEARVAPTPSR